MVDSLKNLSYYDSWGFWHFKEETMKILRLAVITLLIFVLKTGCSGGYQNLETSPGNELNITHQDLIDNWSDYNIFFHNRSSVGLGVIIFDPKNDNRKILVDKYWGTIKDQETWSDFVKAYTTRDGHFKMTGGVRTPTRSREATGVREIWGPDNQQYGLIVHQKLRDWVFARQIDGNTLKLAWRPATGGGGPVR